jgi:hypothetical protein
VKVFKCWSPDDETEEAASTIHAAAAEYAAAMCAEEVWKAAAGQHCERIEIHVRDEAGAVTRWEIRPETEVNFYATEMKGDEK